MNSVSTDRTTEERQDCINQMEDLSQDVFNVIDNNILLDILIIVICVNPFPDIEAF